MLVQVGFDAFPLSIADAPYLLSLLFPATELCIQSEGCQTVFCGLEQLGDDSVNESKKRAIRKHLGVCI